MWIYEAWQSHARKTKFNYSFVAIFAADDTSPVARWWIWVPWRQRADSWWNESRLEWKQRYFVSVDALQGRPNTTKYTVQESYSLNELNNLTRSSHVYMKMRIVKEESLMHLAYDSNFHARVKTFKKMTKDLVYWRLVKSKGPSSLSFKYESGSFAIVFLFSRISFFCF